MRVDALFIYPIKSCAGIAVESAHVTRRGLVNDRRWMVVDEAGRFLSQRVLPRMALIHPTLDEHRLHVRCDAFEPLELPLLFSNGRSIAINVWDHHGTAVRHEAGSEWFTRALARPVQLVCMPDELVRPIATSAARDDDEVSFADAYPLLVTSSSSLDDLNQRSKSRTDVRRFRPNVVVSGAPPWAEDDWRRLQIGALPFRLPTACARCSVPGLDPDTAEPTKEPLRTLATFRKREHEVYFGVNAIPDSTGDLRVGDPVTLLDSV